MRTDPKRTSDNPCCVVHLDFGYDPGRRKLFTDASPRVFRSERALSEHISDKSAERRLAGSVTSNAILKEPILAGWFMRWRPDNVETTSQLDITDDVFVSGCQL